MTTQTFLIWKIKQLPCPYHHSPCTEERGRPEGISRGRGGSSWRRCSDGGRRTSLRSAKPTPPDAKSVVLESPFSPPALPPLRSSNPSFLKVSALTLPLVMTSGHPSTFPRQFSLIDDVRQTPAHMLPCLTSDSGKDVLWKKSTWKQRLWATTSLGLGSLQPSQKRFNNQTFKGRRTCRPAYEQLKPISQLNEWYRELNQL